jgi:hypothetical protein
MQLKKQVGILWVAYSVRTGPVLGLTETRESPVIARPCTHKSATSRKGRKKNSKVSINMNTWFLYSPAYYRYITDTVHDTDKKNIETDKKKFEQTHTHTHARYDPALVDWSQIVFIFPSSSLQLRFSITAKHTRHFLFSFLRWHSLSLSVCETYITIILSWEVLHILCYRQEEIGISSILIHSTCLYF